MGIMSVNKESLPYRPCAGVMLVNLEGKVFVGQRLDSSVEAWQMPQGGIDEGEDPRSAAIRELREETGIPEHLVQILAQSPQEHYYDLPDELVGKIWKGRYRGQRQIWFLARFSGTDEDVNIETEHQEFRAWKWAEPDSLPDLIVPFKRKLYRDVLREFRDII
jgi:putative (di)nucleoside polyphosphate hydrolase